MRMTGSFSKIIRRLYLEFYVLIYAIRNTFIAVHQNINGDERLQFFLRCFSGFITILILILYLVQSRILNRVSPNLVSSNSGQKLLLISSASNLRSNLQKVEEKAPTIN